MSERKIDRLGIKPEQVDEVVRAIQVVMKQYGITHIDSMHGHLNMFYQSEDYPDGRIIQK